VTAPRLLHVHIDRIVSDRPIDERALREAIAAELGGQPSRGRLPGHAERAAAAAVAREVGAAVPREADGGRR
jgi:hypothetical protein